MLNTIIEGKDGARNIKINNLQALINKNYKTAVDPSEIEKADDLNKNYNLQMERGSSSNKPAKVKVLNYNDYENIINDKTLCMKMKDFKVEALI